MADDIVDPFEGIVDPFSAKPAAEPKAPNAPNQDFSWSRAITDIPSEIKKEAVGAWEDFTKPYNPEHAGTPTGLLETGKRALAPVRGAFSIPVGTARSVLGHGMANLEHATGQGIDYLAGTDRASKDDPEKMYDTAKGDVDLALAAARPRAPVAQPPLQPPPIDRFGVTLTEGERTGNLAARQAEQGAFRGQAGRPAQAHAEEFFNEQRPQQLEQARSDVSRELDPVGRQELAETPNEAAAIAQRGLQSTFRTSKSGVSDAYQRAKDLGGDINADFFDNFTYNIKNDLYNRPNGAVVVNERTPNAANMVDYLNDRIARLRIRNDIDPLNPMGAENGAITVHGPQGNLIRARPTGVTLEGVEEWRKTLSQMRGDAIAARHTNPADYRASQAIIDEFDNQINRAVNSGAFNGDPAAVQAWNSARAAHAEHMAKFGNDAVGRRLREIIGGGRFDDPASLDTVASHLFGSGGGKVPEINIAMAKRVKRILGEDSPEWAAIRQGMLHRIISTAENVADRGPGTIANRLGNFMGSDMAGVLFTPAQRSLLNEYAALHRTLSIPSQGANWPNTAAGVIPHIKKATGHILGAVGAAIGHAVSPIVGGAVGFGAGEAIGYGLRAAEHSRNLRQTARQLPLVNQRLRQWQQASFSAATKATVANETRRAVAANQLTLALENIGIAPQAAAKLLTEGPSSSGPAQADERQRASGGRVQNFDTGGVPTFDERFSGSSPDDPSSDDMVDAVTARAGKRDNIAPNTDWAEREAQLGVKLNQKEEPWSVSGAWEGVKDAAKRFSQYDRQFTEDVLNLPRRAYEHSDDLKKGVKNLLGMGDEERYQLWPEKMVRSGATLPHDVMTGEVPQYELDPKTGEWVTSQELVHRTQDLAGMAGSGGLGAGATDATLGSAPFLRPALKYEGKIYKAPMGGQHLDAIPKEIYPEFQRQAMSGEDISNFNFGFMNHKGHFLNREDALDYAVKEGLIDPRDANQGALTTTLLSDSSKPGAPLAALEREAVQTAEKPRTPEMQVASEAPNRPIAKYQPEKLQSDVEGFLKIAQQYQSKLGDDWLSKLTPEQVQDLKTNATVARAIENIKSATEAGVFNKVLETPINRRSLFAGAGALASTVSNASRLASMFEKLNPPAPVGPSAAETALSKIAEHAGNFKQRSDALMGEYWRAERAVRDKMDAELRDLYKVDEEKNGLRHRTYSGEKAIKDKYEPELTRLNYEMREKNAELRKESEKELTAHHDALGLPKLNPPQQAVLDYLVDRWGGLGTEFKNARIRQNPYQLEDKLRYNDPRWQELHDRHYDEALKKGDFSQVDAGHILSKLSPEEKSQIAEHLKPALLQDENLSLRDMRTIAKAFPSLKGFALFSDTTKPGFAIAGLAKSAEPFYSQVERTIANASQKKMHGEQWANWLKNQPGVKPDELQYTGIDKWLREQSKTKPGQNSPPRLISKDEVLDYLKDNKVAVNDVVKSNDLVPEGVMQDPTRYHGYQLPGGENYREHLLTLPKKEFPMWKKADSDELQALIAKDEKSLSGRGPKFTAADEARYNELRAQLKEHQNARDAHDKVNPEYKSSHWDEPNVLAHVRTNDRDVGGKPSLHIEEIQSDWHQQGRKQGYKEEIPAAERLAALDKLHGIEAQMNNMVRQGKHVVPDESSGYKGMVKTAPEYAALQEQKSELMRRLKGEGIPDAPFKTAWPELALKRMIRMAAEEGKTRISWTPGEAQAARYDLSKHYDSLELTHNRDGVGELSMARTGGAPRIDKLQIKSKDDLVNAVGKDLADKLYEQGYKNNGRASLEGVDLKVGGEGMKGFYDQMLPKMVERLGKAHGVKVQKADMREARAVELYNMSYKDLPDTYKGIVDRDLKGATELHYFDIPDAWKQEVLKGQPLFSDTSHGAAVAANSDESRVGRPRQHKNDDEEVNVPKRAAGGRVVASNIDHAPTEAQKSAGNYSKDHVFVQGLDITIENAKGHTRSGTSKDGKTWQVKMPAHYGYLKRTEGADGDHVDVYLGPHIKSKHVFVVNQVDSESRAFDEHKAILGVANLRQALDIYTHGFSDGKGLQRIGSIVPTSMAQFKEWLKSGKTNKPYALN